MSLMHVDDLVDLVDAVAQLDDVVAYLLVGVVDGLHGGDRLVGDVTALIRQLAGLLGDSLDLVGTGGDFLDGGGEVRYLARHFAHVVGLFLGEIADLL